MQHYVSYVMSMEHQGNDCFFIKERPHFEGILHFSPTTFLSHILYNFLVLSSFIYTQISSYSYFYQRVYLFHPQLSSLLTIFVHPHSYPNSFIHIHLLHLLYFFSIFLYFILLKMRRFTRNLF